jgi:archaellum biogenesis protein FlaJ (TadC family)
MELEMNNKNKGNLRKLPVISGFLSFLVALIVLVGVNIALLIDIDDFPKMFLVDLPIVGFFLGLLGLITSKKSRLNALWGIGISLFILVFTFLMIGLSWVGINPKP